MRLDPRCHVAAQPDRPFCAGELDAGRGRQSGGSPVPQRLQGPAAGLGDSPGVDQIDCATHISDSWGACTTGIQEQRNRRRSNLRRGPKSGQLSGRILVEYSGICGIAWGRSGAKPEEIRWLGEIGAQPPSIRDPLQIRVRRFNSDPSLHLIFSGFSPCRQGLGLVM